jgi:hypothetical protein
MVTYNSGSSQFDDAYAITIDSSKNIYVAGSQGTTFSDWVIRKYNLNGVLCDGLGACPAWGTGSTGMVTYNSGASQYDEAYAITIDSTNSIYVAGYQQTGGYDSAVRKYNQNGVLCDGLGACPAWGTGSTGMVTYNSGGTQSDSDNAITIDSSNNIYVAGQQATNGDDWTIQKYSATGTSAFSSIILTCGTNYFARAYATNTSGTGQGSIQPFTTLACPSSIGITSYTNTTETALNSANCATTGCGARLGGGAGFRQSITITGTNFGTDPGAANRSTATNNIKIGTHQIASANVTAWSATSITFLTDSAVTGDTDTDWGVNFGGAASLTVTASSATSTGADFYVFPQVTSISGVAADSAREYDAGDTDGVITLNGTRFGTALGTGSVSILGSSATTTAWGNTAITAQVPVAIADTLYTGSVIITQGTGGNGKTNTYNTLRILPRITSLVP